MANECGQWIPAFAGMTGIKPSICDTPASPLPTAIAQPPKPASIPFGNNLNLAGVAVPDAFGADTLALAQIEVDYPAVGGSHGLQRDAAAGLRDAIRDPISHFTKRVLAPLTVLLDVQRNANVLVKLLAHDALDDELKRVQRIAASPDQKPGVGTVDVNHRAAGQLVLLGAQGHVDVGAHRGEDALDGLNGGPGGGVRSNDLNRRRLVGRVRLIHQVRFARRALVRIGLDALRRGADAGNADLGQFAANTEEALATSI